MNRNSHEPYPLLRCVVYCLVAPIAKPIYYINRLRWSYKQRKLARQKVRCGGPPPQNLTSSKRRRALTLPLPLSQRSKTASQSQCALLSWLPAELRRQIWEECLGGLTLHLNIHNGHLKSAICSSPGPQELCRGACYSFPKTQRRLLSVLLTCHQGYKLLARGIFQ
jgi:hypothetical protein